MERFVGADLTKCDALALDVIFRDKLIIQSLPSAVAIHVRDKNPATSVQAAVLADQYFEDCQSSPDHPKWQKRFSQNKQMEKPYQSGIKRRSL